MHKVIILQARLASDRFPRRVLADLCGEPALAHIVRRLKAAQRPNEICIAIPDDASENELADVAAGLDVTVCRGSRSDVLGRFIQAAYQTKADIIVRAKGDDPFVSPEELDRQLAAIEDDTEVDFVCTDGLPRGVAVETMRLKTLEKLDYLSRAAAEREHVTVYLQQHPGPFAVCKLHAPHELRKPGLNLSLDTREDYDFISALYAKLCPADGIVSLGEVLALIEHDEHISTVARKLSAVAVGAA